MYKCDSALVPIGEDTCVPYDAYYTDWADRSERSAAVVLSLVLELVRPRSIVDVGCGVGAWLKVAADLGLRDITGVDGAYVPRDQLRFEPTAFVAADLTENLELGRRFGLAISLEVGEHLPASASGVFVDSLVGLSSVILFSAAPPGQGGVNHVNEQWPAYWARLFLEHGYEPVDAICDHIWLDERVDWWYRQDTLLYAAPAARERLGTFQTNPLRPVIHPQWIWNARNQHQRRVPELLDELWSALQRSAAYRWRRIRRIRRS